MRQLESAFDGIGIGEIRAEGAVTISACAMIISARLDDIVIISRAIEVFDYRDLRACLVSIWISELKAEP